MQFLDNMVPLLRQKDKVSVTHKDNRVQNVFSSYLIQNQQLIWII